MHSELPTDFASDMAQAELLSKLQIIEEDRSFCRLRVCNQGILTTAPGSNTVVCEFVELLNRSLPYETEQIINDGRIDLLSGLMMSGVVRSATESLSPASPLQVLALFSKIPSKELFVSATEQIIKLMMQSESKPAQQKLAILLLYTLLPVIRTFEPPLLIRRLKDFAFSVLDPENYHDALGERIHRVGNYEIPRQSIDEFEASLEAKVSQLLGIPREYVVVISREKSILGSRRKQIDGMSSYDDYAVSLIIKQEWLEQQGLTEGYEHTYLRHVAGALNTSLFAIKDSYDFFRDGSNYSAIHLAVELEKELLDILGLKPFPMEFKLMTESGHRNFRKTHIPYKWRHRAMLRIGLDAETDHKIAQVAFALTQGYDNQANKVPVPLLEIVSELHDKVFVNTTWGRHCILLETSKPLVDQLQDFITSVSSQQSGVVDGFQVSRIVGGKQVKYLVEFDGEQVTKVKLVGSDSGHATFELPAHEFKLETFDKIGALQLVDGEYQELFTVGKVLNLLSQVANSEGLSLDTVQNWEHLDQVQRHYPLFTVNKLFAWAQELSRINSNLNSNERESELSKLRSQIYPLAIHPSSRVINQKLIHNLILEEDSDILNAIEASPAMINMCIDAFKFRLPNKGNWKWLQMIQVLLAHRCNKLLEAVFAQIEVCHSPKEKIKIWNFLLAMDADEFSQLLIWTLQSGRQVSGGLLNTLFDLEYAANQMQQVRMNILNDLKQRVAELDRPMSDIIGRYIESNVKEMVEA